jgi:RNA polymerase sigma-70 factor (ECF subfamily)
VSSEPLTRGASDERAFRDIFGRYHRLVYSLALSVVSNHDLAEDVSQSIFLKIWERPGAFHGGSFTAWITRVTLNRSIDLLRHNAANARNERRGFLPDAVMPFERVLVDSDIVRLHRSLRALTEKQRALIALSYFEGMTHAQIAGHTGIPLGTVKTRLRAGIAQLRKLLFVLAEP